MNKKNAFSFCRFLNHQNSNILDGVIEPAENWIEARKNQLLNGNETEVVSALKREIEALKNSYKKNHLEYASFPVARLDKATSEMFVR